MDPFACHRVDLSCRITDNEKVITERFFGDNSNWTDFDLVSFYRRADRSSDEVIVLERMAMVCNQISLTVLSARKKICPEIAITVKVLEEGHVTRE